MSASRRPAPGKIGILLLGHGDLAGQMLEAARVIYQQPIAAAVAVCADASYDREQLRGKTAQGLRKLGRDCRHVLVLCDSCGATAARLMNAENFPRLDFRCIYGVNLPMLLDCISLREGTADLDDLAERVCAAGRLAIKHRNPCAAHAEETAG